MANTFTVQENMIASPIILNHKNNVILVSHAPILRETMISASMRQLNLEQEKRIQVSMTPKLKDHATLVSNIVFPKEDRILVQVVIIPKNGHDTISICTSSERKNIIRV